MPERPQSPDVPLSDPDPSLVAYLEQVKYPKARKFLGYLKEAGIRALQIDNLGWDGVGEAYVDFADVDVIVRYEDRAPLIALLVNKGYQMVRDDTIEGSTAAVSVGNALPFEYAVGSTVYSWTDEVKWPVDLWVAYQNTRQHWSLMFVDLAPWFEPGAAEAVTVLGDTEVELPPACGRMLWLINNAMERAETHNCIKLREKLAAIKSLSAWPTFSWDQFLVDVRTYEAESEERVRRYLQFTGELDNPTLFASRPLPNEKGTILSASYHVLQAVETLYPGTVPASALSSLAPGACPRLLGILQGDVVKIRYHETRTVVDCCLPSFGIAQQLQEYEHLTGQELIGTGAVEVYAHCDYGENPPQSRLTPEQFEAIFAPLA